MQILYDGFLDERTTGYIRILGVDYPHFVEIKVDLPWKEFIDWQHKNCPAYPVAQEDCMGGDYTVYRPLYGTVSGCDKRFLAFKSQSEKDMFLTDWADYVVKPEPFKVMFG